MSEEKREGRPFVVHFRVPGRREAVTVALREVPGTAEGVTSAFGMGIAFCSGSDQFTKRIGAMIATNRLHKYGIVVRWERAELFELAWKIVAEAADDRTEFVRSAKDGGLEPSTPRWLPDFVDALRAQWDKAGT